MSENETCRRCGRGEAVYPIVESDGSLIMACGACYQKHEMIKFEREKMSGKYK